METWFWDQYMSNETYYDCVFSYLMFILAFHFSPPPSKGNVAKSRVYYFTKRAQPFKQAPKHRTKIIFREHGLFSALMWKPSLTATDSDADFVNANKPTVWQAKCIWKQTLPFSPVECASYGNMEKLARPPFAVCTMDLQRATEPALYMAHAYACH